MSHGPQKICPQPLPLRLDPDLLLLLDMSGQGTGHDRDQKKRGKGQKIARPLKFKLIVGRQKRIVDHDRRRQAGSDPIEIAAGVPGDQEHSRPQKISAA